MHCHSKMINTGFLWPVIFGSSLLCKKSSVIHNSDRLFWDSRGYPLNVYLWCKFIVACDSIFTLVYPKKTKSSHPCHTRFVLQSEKKQQTENCSVHTPEIYATSYGHYYLARYAQ